MDNQVRDALNSGVWIPLVFLENVSISLGI